MKSLVFGVLPRWTDTLTDIGFTILQEDSIEPRYSRAYVSDWIVKIDGRIVYTYIRKWGELVSLPVSSHDYGLSGSEINIKKQPFSCF